MAAGKETCEGLAPDLRGNPDWTNLRNEWERAVLATAGLQVLAWSVTG
jgi:hypothetical protein